MKRDKKDLILMTDDELVSRGVKNHKLSNLFGKIKWGGFLVLSLGTLITPLPTSYIMAMSNFIFVNILGTTQIIFSSKRNKCAKVLESRGCRYKLTEKIENKIEEPYNKRFVTKEEIKECGDVFPEFATNYRISTQDDNNIQNEK